jgi:uncharacterized membrane protein (GlpM family)
VPVPAQNVAVKMVVTPVLIGAASLAGRRFGHHIGGWLVALPMTSGPVAFFLAVDQGESFAAGAATGMLAATLSQVAFALAYSRGSGSGATRAFLAGSAAFAVSTLLLSFLHWTAWEIFALVLCGLVIGYAATRRRASEPSTQATQPPRWDIPVRMVAATLVVVVITSLAPVLGSHLAGLLSPFPVFAAVLAVFTHRTHGSTAAKQTLHGLLLGLIAPAVFFLVLAVTLRPAGLWAFGFASAAAFAAQGMSLFAIPRAQQAPAA